MGSGQIAYALSEDDLPILQVTYSACAPAIGYSHPNRPACSAHNDSVLEYLKSNDEIKSVVLMAFYSGHAANDSYALWGGVNKSIRELKRYGKNVVILGPVPVEGRDIVSLLFLGEERYFALPPEPHQLRELRDTVGVISVSDLLCQGDVCPMVVDGMPILFDQSHISLTAARWIAPQLKAQLVEYLAAHPKSE